MSWDKLRDTFPVSVTFAKGEQPSGDKMTAFASQVDGGLALVEKAIGDVWGDQVHNNGTGDYTLTRYCGLSGMEPHPLQIASLARLVGPASALNPMRESRYTRETISVQLAEEDVPAGVTEFMLPYPALKVGAFPYSNFAVDDITGAGHIRTVLATLSPTIFSTFVASPDLVNGAGDYHIDTFGRVYCFTPTLDWSTGTGTGALEPADTGGTPTYTTVVYSDAYDGATMNVIPDPNQTATSSLCQVTHVSGTTYTIVLPLIQKLDRLATDGTSYVVGHWAASGNTHRGNMPSVTGSYQAYLPAVLDNVPSGVAIPDGFVALWDTEATGYEDVGGRIISGVISFTKGANNYTLSCSGVVLPGVTVPSGTNSSRYRLITIGTTVTESIADLRWRHDTHDHSDPFGCAPVPHSSVSGTRIAHDDIVSKWGVTVNGAPSSISGNDHTQYLCRYGWVSGLDSQQFDGAMLGHLFMATQRTSYTPTNYTSTSTQSRRIYFGNADVSIHFNASAFVQNGLYLTAGTDHIIANTTDLHIGNAGSIASPESAFALHFNKDTVNQYGKLEWSVAKSFACYVADSVAASAFQAGKLIVHADAAPMAPGGEASCVLIESSQIQFLTNTATTYGQISISTSALSILAGNADLSLSTTGFVDRDIILNSGKDVSITAAANLELAATTSISLDAPSITLPAATALSAATSLRITSDVLQTFGGTYPGAYTGFHAESGVVLLTTNSSTCIFSLAALGTGDRQFLLPVKSGDTVTSPVDGSCFIYHVPASADSQLAWYVEGTWYYVTGSHD